MYGLLIGSSSLDIRDLNIHENRLCFPIERSIARSAPSNVLLTERYKMRQSETTERGVYHADIHNSEYPHIGERGQLWARWDREESAPLTYRVSCVSGSIMGSTIFIESYTSCINTHTHNVVIILIRSRIT